SLARTLLFSCSHELVCLLFFFIVPATPEIYTLSLHDALPICRKLLRVRQPLLHLWPAGDARRAGTGIGRREHAGAVLRDPRIRGDRKSTRLNSSHVKISYAVFCLKKKTHEKQTRHSSKSGRMK